MFTTFGEEPPPWDIYAKQLFPLGHGFPLWVPEPDLNAAEVMLGDVGWTREGGFLQLFNAMKSEDQQPMRYGVPDGYVPFNPPDLHVSVDETSIRTFFPSHSISEQSYTFRVSPFT